MQEVVSPERKSIRPMFVCRSLITKMVEITGLIVLTLLWLLLLFRNTNLAAFMRRVE